MAVARQARGEERQAVSAYVVDRLEAECSAERGVASAIARATGFSTAAITNVRKRERGVGDDLARALGRYWGFPSYGDLESEALRWVTEHPERAAGDACPNRTLAAQLCRDHGVPEAAVVAGARGARGPRPQRALVGRPDAPRPDPDARRRGAQVIAVTLRHR